MTCPEEGEIALFFDGHLDPSRIDRLELHLDGCPACLSLVAAVAPALDSQASGSGRQDLRAPSLLRVGDVLAERYEIQRVLGAGATGYVYQARDRLVDTVVALKVLRPTLADDPAWVGAFVAELQLARRLTHPNVCRVFDMQQTEGHCFLTMELASRGSLREEMRTHPGRGLAEKVGDALALASGVAAMHAAGIVHRDVKPGNVLRTEDGRLVLSDFGLARASVLAAPATGAVGTPTYIAPEVIAGEPATPRSDVWSLGVTLHELFFDAKPSADGRSRKREPLADALARLCRDCLVANPGGRPLDAAAVLERLRRIQQQPTSRRRRRAWALTALGLAGLASAGALVKARLARTEPLIPIEIAPTIALGKPKGKGELSSAELQAVQRALERAWPDLARSPIYRLAGRPAARPGPDDWTLEPEVERSGEDLTVRYLLGNGMGERTDLGSSTGPGWLRGEVSSPASRSHLQEQMMVFALSASRRSWADRGTRSVAARAAVRSLLENVREPDSVHPDVALSTLDLALKEDPVYLAAHTERGLALARKAALLNRPVPPEALLAEEQKLGALAPQVPRVLAARCRLLEAAFGLAPEPTDAELATALELCGRAAEVTGIGIEPRRSLARLQALTCDPAGAVVSLRRALAFPSPGQADLLRDWAGLALREHWHHGGYLERLSHGHQVQWDIWRRAGDTFGYSFPLMLGSLWLRQEWPDRAARQFDKALKLHPAFHAVQGTALFGGLSRARGPLPPDERPPASWPVPASLEVLSEIAADIPWAGHAIVEMLSWTEPTVAAGISRTLAPAPTCRVALERAALERAVAAARATESPLLPCRSSVAWVQRCRARLATAPGGGDPFEAERP